MWYYLVNGLHSSRMNRAAARSQKALVSGILHQRVLEKITGIRRFIETEYQTRTDKLI